jgi:glycosyltransferase involved in cell wall biosynthesis
VSQPRIILYADVNLGLIDGSSIWAASVAEALAGAGAAVTLLSKFPIHDYRVLAPLADRPEVRLLDPELEGLVERGRRLLPADAARAIATLDETIRATAIVVRGSALSDALTQAKVGRGRLWCYLTDIPQSVTDANPERIAQLGRIASWASRLLCQTEELRGFIEGVVPAASGKTFLLPPIVPDQPAAPRRQEPARSGCPMKLVYSGKFAAHWSTLEMCAIPSDLRRSGVDAKVVMLGDKIHNEPERPDYQQRMRLALTNSYGVEWLGGLARHEALENVASADVALAWRAPELDASLELSTKLLEFGACGVPTVLNRTPMHERLLGQDYPLFANSYEEVLDAISQVAKDPSIGESAAKVLGQVAARFSMKEASRRIRVWLDKGGGGAVGWPGGKSQTVLIAGHDLKFVRSIADYLDSRDDTRVIYDEWQGHTRHDPALSERRLREADVVLCEWMLGNAVWYSHNKRPGQRLVVRLHRVEAETDYPGLVDADAVDAVVFVGRDMAVRTQQKFGLPKSKLVVVPNAVDHASFVRPKDHGHEYVLGMIGVIPKRKRLDLAIELLRNLRMTDKRFRLHVKGKAPWELPWVWNRPAEREYFDNILDGLADDPDLADAIAFDPAGPDVAAWLRKVGWLVSTSDEESFHVSVAEGMSSGAVPLVRKWQGAADIYSPEWLHTGVGSMAARVGAALADGTYDELAGAAQTEAARFDVAEVASAIASVLADRHPSMGVT